MIPAESPTFARRRRAHLLSHGKGAYTPVVKDPRVVERCRGASRVVALREAAHRLVDAWALVRPPFAHQMSIVDGGHWKHGCKDSASLVYACSACDIRRELFRMRTTVCPASQSLAPRYGAKTVLENAWKAMAKGVRASHSKQKEALKAARRRAAPMLGE